MLPLLVRAYFQSRDRNYCPERARKSASRLRAAAYLSGVLTLLLAGSYKAARAAVEGQALTVGREMMPATQKLSEYNDFRLNGEHMFLSRSVSPTSLHETQAYYRSLCEPGSSKSFFKAAADLAPEETKNFGLSSSGIIEKESSEAAMVLCLVKGDSTPATAFEAIQSFHENNDLGSLGKIRYIYMEKDSSEPNTKTRVLSIWTEDHFRINSFFPENGDDAPGHDSGLVARPPKSQRLLSGEAIQTPYAFFIYRTELKTDEVLDYYDKTLHASSWLKAPFREQDQKDRGYDRQGMQVILSVHEEESSHKTIVTLAEAGPEPQVNK